MPSFAHLQGQQPQGPTLSDAISKTTSPQHDGLNVLALAVKCALESSARGGDAASAADNRGKGGGRPQARQPGVSLVEALLAAGASPVTPLAPSESIPESINGVRQARYARSPLGLAILGKVR